MEQNWERYALAMELLPFLVWTSFLLSLWLRWGHFRHLFLEAKAQGIKENRRGLGSLFPPTHDNLNLIRLG